jgi:three-Cys-motif partner protein
MTTNRRNGYVEIKPHWEKKHRILGKYINACFAFQKKYNNFAYIDTHGGSGRVFIDGKLKDGSPLIAAKELSAFPCYTTEINDESYSRLVETTKGYPNIKAVKGDCNALLPGIVATIESWRFCLCFVDPDGLVYHDKSKKKTMQLTSATIDLIAKSAAPRMELLLNLPIMPILRVMGYVEKLPEEKQTPAMEEDVSMLYGSEDWRSASDGRSLLDVFLDARLAPFEFKGAFLVRDTGNRPLYYLVYGSHNETGAKIMKNVMQREYQQLLLTDYPLNRFYFAD